MYGHFGRFPQLPFWAKVGEIPSSYKVAMSYEEQLLWLCHEIERIESLNGNVDYNALINKPIINGVTLQGTLTLPQLDIQQKLQAGRGIIIDGNVISATGGGGTGGTDNYEDLVNKPSINGVVLIGDKSLSDLGLETTKTYTELTDFVDDYYFNLQIPIRIGDNVPNLTAQSNTKYMALKISDLPSTKFRINGHSDSVIYFTCSDNPLVEGSIIKSMSAINIGYTDEEIPINVPTGANYIVFNFTDTDEEVPKVEVITETIGGTSNYNNLTNKPSINGVELIGDKSWEDLGLPTSTTYTELTDYEVGYCFDITTPPYRIGSGVPSPTSHANSQFLLLKISDLPSTKFRITGRSEKVVWFTCTDDPLQNISLIKSLSATDIGYTDYELNMEIPSGANYIVFNFTDTDEINPKVEVISQTMAGASVRNLDTDIILVDNVELNLDTGFYNTTSHYVYDTSVSENNKLIGVYEMFYYDKVNKAILTNLQKIIQIEGLWYITNNQPIKDTLTDDPAKIPTSHAVYEALQNIQPSVDLFYTKLTASLDLGLDGSVTSGGNTLTTGYYLTSYGVSIEGGSIDLNMANCILYYDSHFATLMKAIKNSDFEAEYFYYYTNEWSKINRNFNTEIPATGSNNNIPTNLAVRNYVDDKLNNICYCALTNNITLTPVSTYTPVDVKIDNISKNDDYISFDNTTGKITFLQSGTYEITLTTQLRGSDNTTTDIILNKGFGFRHYRNNNVLETYTGSETMFLSFFSSMFTKFNIEVQANDYIQPIAYSRVMSGTIGSKTTTLQGTARTTITINKS